MLLSDAKFYINLKLCYFSIREVFPWACSYNGAPLVAFYDTLGIRRTYSRLEPPGVPHGGIYNWNIVACDVKQPTLSLHNKHREYYVGVGSRITEWGMMSQRRKDAAIFDNVVLCKYSSSLPSTFDFLHENILVFFLTAINICEKFSISISYM